MNLGIVADWASILALLVTAFNAFQIRNIKRRMVINLTLEALLERLQNNSREMNRFLSVYETAKSDFDGVIGVCEANVRAVRRRLGARRSRFCKQLLNRISAYGRQQRKATARAVYDTLQQVIQEIANRVEEIRIAGP